MRTLIIFAFLTIITLVTLSGNIIADETKGQKMLKLDGSYEYNKSAGDFKLVQESTPQGINYKWVPARSDELSNDKQYDTPFNTHGVKSNGNYRSEKSNPDRERNFRRFSDDSIDRADYEIGDQITLKGAKPAGPPINPLATDNIYTQNFYTVPPSGWSTYSEGPDYWEWREEGNYNWAWCNSDEAGQGTDITEWLYMTSGVDCTNYENLVVKFESLYDYYDGDEYCKMLYATEESYPTFQVAAIWYREEDEHDWTLMTIPLHDSLDHEPELHIAFKYHGTWDWYWKVDDMRLIGDQAVEEVEIFAEDFEGSFPEENEWIVGDNNQDGGEDFWDDVSCGGPAEGSWHVWCADDGDQSNCDTYDNYMEAYMISRLIEIYDYEDVQYSFTIKHELEEDYDFFIAEVWGDITGWETLYTVTGTSDGWPNYVGYTTVFIPDDWYYMRVKYTMTSDYSITREGVYIDDIVITGILRTSIDDRNISIPNRIALDQNYPNPFNPQTTIEYTLPERSNVSIEVFDMLGRKVETLVNGNQQPGLYQVTWDADQYPSGIYFYKIQAGEFVETKKMLLLK